MKKPNAFLLSLIGASTLALGAAALALEGDQPKKAALGKEVPDFTLVDSKGQERRLADHKGHIVVLEWINQQCPWVEGCYKREGMQKAYEQAREASPDLVWMAINTTSDTTPEENNGWITHFKLKYPILLDKDGEVGRMYAARRTPHLFVIDQEGILRYHGAIDNNQFSDKSGADYVNYVVGAVRQIVAGETVAPDYVEPWGCTVKYKR